MTEELLPLHFTTTNGKPIPCPECLRLGKMVLLTDCHQEQNPDYDEENKEKG